MIVRVCVCATVAKPSVFVTVKEKHHTRLDEEEEEDEGGENGWRNESRPTGMNDIYHCVSYMQKTSIQSFPPIHTISWQESFLLSEETLEIGNAAKRVSLCLLWFLRLGLLLT